MKHEIWTHETKSIADGTIYVDVNWGSMVLKSFDSKTYGEEDVKIHAQKYAQQFKVIVEEEMKNCGAFKGPLSRNPTLILSLPEKTKEELRDKINCFMAENSEYFQRIDDLKGEIQILEAQQKINLLHVRGLLSKHKDLVLGEVKL